MVLDIVKDVEKLQKKCKTVTKGHKAELDELLQNMRIQLDKGGRA